MNPTQSGPHTGSAISEPVGKIQNETLWKQLDKVSSVEELTSFLSNLAFKPQNNSSHATYPSNKPALRTHVSCRFHKIDNERDEIHGNNILLKLSKLGQYPNYELNQDTGQIVKNLATNPSSAAATAAVAAPNPASSAASASSDKKSIF